MFTKSRRSGFTLPEILVTVTVIAVLAAVVVPAVTQYASKGDAPSTKSDVLQLSTAITSFASDVRYYPGDLRQLTTAIDVSGTYLGSGFGSASVSHLYASSDTPKWKGPYTPSTLTASGYANLAGYQVQVGPTLDVAGAWLRAPIFSIAGVTTIAVSGTCSGLVALDAAVDGTANAGLEKSTGQIQWTGACDGTGVGAVTAAYLRLIPAP